jgi:hypothetical protein
LGGLHWQATLKEILLAGDTQLYVLVESSVDFDLEFLAETHQNTPLLSEQDLEDQTLHIYHIPLVELDDLLPSLLIAGLGKNALCFISSILSMTDLLAQLHRYTKARDKNNELYWLRFWDTRVMPTWVNNLNADEYTNFFFGIRQIWVEDYKDPQNILNFTASSIPEIQKSDKPNTWNDKQEMLLRPELQQQLVIGHREYLCYQLSKKLINEYPQKDKIDMKEVEDWVNEQDAYCNKMDIALWTTVKNLIISTWVLKMSKVEMLRKKIILDDKLKHLSIEVQSEDYFKTITKQHN